ncbi:MAG: hypothetical protein U0271_24205 [Polyangiaceae bacterium]
MGSSNGLALTAGGGVCGGSADAEVGALADDDAELVGFAVVELEGFAEAELEGLADAEAEGLADAELEDDVCGRPSADDELFGALDEDEAVADVPPVRGVPNGPPAATNGIEPSKARTSAPLRRALRPMRRSRR